MAVSPDVRVRWVGDRALRITLAPAPSAEAASAAELIARGLRRRPMPGMVDALAAYGSVLVTLSPLAASTSGESARSDLSARARMALLTGDGSLAQGRRFQVPVRYGGDDGPDLEDVARLTGLTAGEVITRHAGRIYTVMAIGFRPGFPYLGDLHPSLRLPRLATPRTHVPVGSVAIAGGQTGIYSTASAGGWRILGRSSIRLFHPEAKDLEQSVAFRVGDEVVFVPAQMARS